MSLKPTSSEELSNPTTSRSITLADGGIGVYEQARTKDRFTLVLLKNEGLIWPTYFMERRRSNDSVYPGRIGLFGGKIEAGETFRECAVREIYEETGIRIAQSDLVLLLDFKGENDRGDVNEGEIFIYTFKGKHSTSVEKIKKAQKILLGSLKDPDDAPGQPISITYWQYPVWKLWFKMTPQAAYALLADHDRSLRTD
jgi:8-oxo-dGTP pyrophosphatase MutT (NUDIX family)